ncbi:MAG TPA: DNA-processing protein DprA, partial [Firmicutes bacterium]|nr:DNA-processing protein DprA [Bacillota bacterium]
MSDVPYWLALTRISVLGARRILRLLHYAGSAEKAFTLTAGQLAEAGIPPKTAAAVLQERTKIDPEREWRQCRDLGIEVVRITDDGYPPLLLAIYDPPPLLFYRGELPRAEDTAVAVVGSRKASAYGRAAAERISAGLAAAGVVVISG